MKIEEIRVPNPDAGEESLLAVIAWSADDGPPPIESRPSFQEIIPARESIQAIVATFPKGYKVEPHAHLQQLRTTNETQEILVVLTGTIHVDFYRTRPHKESEWVCRRVLTAGDFVALLHGGHGVQVIADARVLEVKTGPYFGREFDKAPIRVNQF